ncbi:roadblock/LC7 domain-containing protein [Micromonospora zhanjiangensis]|uniref:Roadblock/LC7 domain-containing protein n=1 Tax=Micromonospora zhanjiangensis TaxID=1522057 RepID=A0ABV8KIA3_9ACTN
MTHSNGSGATFHPVGARGPQEFAWLIQQFVDETPDVVHALLVSLDGLQLVSSAGIGRDLGDQLAALTAGMISMADRGADLLNLGSAEYLTIRLPRGHLLLMRVDMSAGLAVAVGPNCDLRTVAYRMTRLVGSVGHLLTPQIRSQLHRLSASRQ